MPEAVAEARRQELAAWRFEMRSVRPKLPLRLHATERFHRFERAQQTGDVFRIGGVNDVEIKSADRRAMQNRGDSPDHDEVHTMVNEGSNNVV